MRKISYAAGLGICLLLCACSQQKLSAYNSDSGKTQEIGFEDLQVGDYVVIGLYENEKAQAQTETIHAESVERMRQKSAQD